MIAIPESSMLLTIFGLLIAEVTYFGEKNRLAHGIAIFGILTASIQLVWSLFHLNTEFYGGFFVNDSYSVLFRALFLLLGLLQVLQAYLFEQESRTRLGERYILVICATTVGMLLMSSTHLLISFLLIGFLVLLISGLILTSEDFRSTAEAGWSFYSHSGLAVGFLFLGLILFFFFSDDLLLRREAIHSHLGPDSLTAVRVVLVTFLFGALVLVSLFPFQLWGHQVFAKTSTLWTGYILTLIRLAIFGWFTRLLMVWFGPEQPFQPNHLDTLHLNWTPLLSIIAGVTTFLSSVVVFRHTQMKPILSGLFLGQLGFYVLGWLYLNDTSVGALVLNLLVELICGAALFSSFSLLERHFKTDDLAEFRGVFGKNAFITVVFLIAFASLAGVPPLPGFTAKFGLLLSILNDGQVVLASVMLISYLLNLILALRLVNLSLDGALEQVPVRVSVATQNVYLGTLLIPVILLCFFSQGFMLWAIQSVRLIYR